MPGLKETVRHACTKDIARNTQKYMNQINSYINRLIWESNY